jgi:hypothetical protein
MHYELEAKICCLGWEGDSFGDEGAILDASLEIIYL